MRMPIYTYPEMPIEAAVWYLSDAMIPPGPPDAFVQVSLSPIRPEDYFRGVRTPGELPATHIIRTAVHELIGDNWNGDPEQHVLPATIFQIPNGEERYYVTLWAHQVGAGFHNWHSRIYAARIPLPWGGPAPLYQGWI